MIILIIIFFIIPHFDGVKFRRTDTLPSFIIFVKSWGGRLWRVSDCEELVGVIYRRNWAKFAERNAAYFFAGFLSLGIRLHKRSLMP